MKDPRWNAKGGVRRSGVDTLVGISTYDCPEGVHRSAKQSSPNLDPVSSFAGSLLHPFTSPERDNVSRYTRKQQGVGYLSAVRCRCCCLVSGSIYSTRIHDLRNSRGSPTVSLSLSSLFRYLLSVQLTDPERSSSPIGETNQPASRIYGTWNVSDAHSSSHVTSGNSMGSLSFHSQPSCLLIFFSRDRIEERNERSLQFAGQFKKMSICGKKR